MTYAKILAAAPLALLVTACSNEPATPAPAPDETAAAAAASPVASADPTATPASVLRLEGLGDLEIGKPVPSDSTFKAGELQASESCQTYASPDFPGVYAMVEDGQVRRITAGRNSKVKLVEGIGAGASEKEVLAAFPGFVASPHHYVAAPAKDLTQPGDDPRLRFEIGEDGKVTDVHVGLTPQLGYVEGCA